MSKSLPANVFPLRPDVPKGSLLVRNEGTRALQIIGDVMADGERVLPGSSFEIDLARSDGPVQITFYDGGIQIDSAVDNPCACKPRLEDSAMPGKIA